MQKTIIEKIIPYVVPKVTIAVVVIDNYMAVIQVQIQKNIV